MSARLSELRHDAVALMLANNAGEYRYLLERDVGAFVKPLEGAVVFCMLNPSTADATKDDPTIRRCVGFARTWGYAKLYVVNVFALRATNPRNLANHPEPAGPQNDAALIFAGLLGAPIVVAWGAHNAVTPAIARRTFEQLSVGHQPVSCLGLTMDGAPRHPLYVRSDAFRIPWSPA